jgi:hypothetical protein
MALAGGTPNRVDAVRTTQPPTIDGRVDDSAWQAAEPSGAFTQLYPDENTAPTQATDVRVLYDDDAIYVAVQLRDSDPDQIVARLAPRDRAIEADQVTIAFDSRHDGTTARWFRLSAASVQSDGVVLDGDTPTTEWDAVWTGAAITTTDGWNAEFAIPLSVLRFSGGAAQEWGFQVTRYIARRRESSVLAYVPSTARGAVSRYAILAGLRDLRPRRYVELRPYALLGARSIADSSADSTSALVEGGVDLKLGVSSDTIVDVTINPDFTSVDADEIVLHLSRYELFVSEKRQFFLDGNDVFTTPLTVFHSRRIGERLARNAATELADPPRIVGAAKLVGRTGEHFVFGALQALTGEQADGFAPPIAYSVLAGRYTAGSTSHLGLLSTARVRANGHITDARADHDSVVQSADGQWQSADSATRLTAQTVISKQVDVATHADAAGGRCDPTGAPDCTPLARVDGTRIRADGLGVGASAGASFTGDHLVARGRYDAFSSQFDLDDVGFQPEANRQVGELSVGYRSIEPGRVLRRWGVYAEAFGKARFDATPLERGNVLRIEGELAGQTSFVIRPYVLYPSWDVAETGDGARLEVESNAGATFEITTNPRGTVAATVSGWAGSSLGPSRYRDANLTPVIQLRLDDRLDLSIAGVLAVNWNMLRALQCTDLVAAPCNVDTDERVYVLGDARVIAASATLRAAYTVSPTMFVQAYGQLFWSRSQHGPFYGVMTHDRAPAIRRRDLAPATMDLDIDRNEVALQLRLQSAWDFRRGSRLSIVYIREQQWSTDTRTLAHTLMTKLTYFWD